jgi:hypothetical protein
MSDYLLPTDIYVLALTENPLTDTDYFRRGPCTSRPRKQLMYCDGLFLGTSSLFVSSVLWNGLPKRWCDCTVQYIRANLANGKVCIHQLCLKFLNPTPHKHRYGILVLQS